jgi:large subunit ribosomal protein L15
MITLNAIKPKSQRVFKKRIARGGKKGASSGRGTKGQKSRAGHKIRPAFRETLKKFPKKRGYRMSSQIKREHFATVNLEQLEKTFSNGSRINPKVLLENKLVNLYKGHLPSVKILSDGNLSKKFNISQCVLSKNAKEKVLKSGGEIS